MLPHLLQVQHDSLRFELKIIVTMMIGITLVNRKAMQ